MKIFRLIIVVVWVFGSPLPIMAADLYIGLNGGSMTSSTRDQGSGYCFTTEFKLLIFPFIGLGMQVGNGKFGSARLDIGTREGSKVLFDRYSVLLGDFRNQKISYFFSLGRNNIDANRDFDYNTDGWHTNVGIGVSSRIYKRVGINLNLATSGWMKYSRFNTATIGINYLLLNGGI